MHLQVWSSLNAWLSRTIAEFWPFGASLRACMAATDAQISAWKRVSWILQYANDCKWWNVYATVGWRQDETPTRYCCIASRCHASCLEFWMRQRRSCWVCWHTVYITQAAHSELFRLVAAQLCQTFRFSLCFPSPGVYVSVNSESLSDPSSGFDISVRRFRDLSASSGVDVSFRRFRDCLHHQELILLSDVSKTFYSFCCQELMLVSHIPENVFIIRDWC
jgi:hypothetical protein